MKKINIKHWQSDKDIKLLFNILKKKNEETRFIGGCIRDLIINKKDSDIDLATTLEPNHVLSLLHKRKIKTITSGITHGTIIAILNKKKFEITTLRKDIKTDGRHAVVQYTRDWVIDSERRDFTINAISCDFDGNLYDYHNGISDLKKGNIRFIGDINRRINEDYLRLLRFFRFYAYYGKKKINKEDLIACKNFSVFLKKLSSERIYSEFKKILLNKSAFRILDMMMKHNILQYIIFGRINLNQIKNLEKIDAQNNFLNFNNKLASILPSSYFYFNKTLKFLKLPNNEKKILSKIFFQKKKFKFSKKKEDIKKFTYIFGKELCTDLIILDCAKKIRNKKTIQNYLETINFVKKIKKPVFPVQGKDILKLGIVPGPKIGKYLKKIEEWWIKNNFKPSKQECIEKIQSL